MVRCGTGTRFPVPFHPSPFPRVLAASSTNLVSGIRVAGAIVAVAQRPVLGPGKFPGAGAAETGFRQPRANSRASLPLFACSFLQEALDMLFHNL